MARTVIDTIINAAAAIAGVLVVIVMLLVCGKVFSRYFFGVGIVGLDQISGMLLTYVTFLAAPWVLRRQEHVTIDLLLTAMGKKSRLYVELVAIGLGALVCLIVTYFGVMETYGSWRRGVLVAAEIEIPRVYTLAIIPIGCGLLFVQFLREFRSKLHAIKNAVVA